MRIFVAKLPASSPQERRSFWGPLPGLDHMGFRVSDVDAAIEALRSKGVRIAIEPVALRPGVKYAYVLGPDNVRIEILSRAPIDLAPAST